jgi:multiple sugar transport system permease protein
LVPALVFLGYFAAYPLVTLGRMSLSDVGFENILGDWPGVGLHNYAVIIHRPEFQEALLNTLIFVAVVVGVSLVGGMIAALVILPSSLASRFIQSLLLFCWMLPHVVTGGLWKFLFSSDGVVNSLLGPIGLDRGWLFDYRIVLYSVAFVNAWAALPFAAVVLKAGLLGIPSETQEAAAVDGATKTRIFWTVTLPQLRPVVLVLAVLLTVNAFRSFDFIYVLTNGGPGTASTTLPYLSYRDAFVVGYFGQGAAVAGVTAAFTLVAAVAYVVLTWRSEAKA